MQRLCNDKKEGRMMVLVLHLSSDMREWAFPFCVVDVFARFSPHAMPVCKAQIDMGWMLAT